MKNDDIEILEDFSNNQTPSNGSIQEPVQNFGQNLTYDFSNNFIEETNKNNSQSPVTEVNTNPVPYLDDWEQPSMSNQMGMSASAAPTSEPSPIPDLGMPTNAAPTSEPSPIPDFGMPTGSEMDMNINSTSSSDLMASVQPSESVSEFEKMVNESPSMETTSESDNKSNDSFIYQDQSNLNNNSANQFFVDSNISSNQSNQSYNNQSYENGFISNDYVSDANNDLVQSNGSDNKDLTITAVYPNGLAVDQKDEIENTQVIKPKKKGTSDLPLIIIVAILAITLVVLLIVFYL